MDVVDSKEYENALRKREDGRDVVGGDRDMGDVFSYLGELFSKLSSDAGNLITLQMELLKAEVRESATVMIKNSVLITLGAVVGMLSFAIITLALTGFIAAALHIQEDPMAWAVAALIVGVVYALIAGGLVFAGLKHLKGRKLAPERTIEEIKRDKEWVKEIKS